MSRLWSPALFLLLLLLKLALADQHSCSGPERRCDFVCDCSDCSDEQDCGYRGKEFVCDFEHEGGCGWTAAAPSDTFRWERQQRDLLAADSGPLSDYTTGTAKGWFMGVTAVEALNTGAVLVSPEMKQSAPTCRLRLRYFIWTGDPQSILWATIHYREGPESVIWRQSTSNIRDWREATIFIGRISEDFRIHFHAKHSLVRRGDIAIDQLEFLDCGLPLPPLGDKCPEGTLTCRNDACVASHKVCDGSDDCGDGTDEICDSRLCDFEHDECDWDLRSLSNLLWVRTNQRSISETDPLKGPGRDHSTNTASGHFLYVTVPNGGLKKDWAAFQSPLLEPTDSANPCKMTMYTHQFGPRSGGLTVLVAAKKIYPVWERGGALGDVWVKAEVEIVSEHPFQIVFMAAIRDFYYGGIAIDSILLSPGCKNSSDDFSWADFPDPPKNPCTTPDKICNFYPDCLNDEDEAKCGDFSYPNGSTGWTDSSIGSQGWVLHRNSTSNEDHLYVSEASGQQLTDAQTRTPLLGPTGPACSVTFQFSLTGNSEHIGEVSLLVFDNQLDLQSKLWEFSGKTGTQEEEGWREVQVPLGVRKHRFQLVFEARSVKLSASSNIRVRNVIFNNCNPEYIPSSPSGLACNFEGGLCGWYQDNSDSFDWTVVEGMDHTIDTGKSLVVDFWSASLRGAYGRLVSYTLPSSAQQQCLSFFFKLYGPNPGALNVKVIGQSGYELTIWTRSGDHGNVWQEAHCPVPPQLTNVQLSIEAVRSGFDGQVAIDDVSLKMDSCSVARFCSFEEQQCGYSSSGEQRWVWNNGLHEIPGPPTDHTLETDTGNYMVVSSLRAGSAAVLTSPVNGGIVRTECVHFWYYTSGVNSGSLSVYVTPVKGKRVKIFSVTLNLQNAWVHGSGNISTTLTDWQLDFEVIGDGTVRSYVAIDDISLSLQPCDSPGLECTFEEGMCNWSNSLNPKLDTLDWVRTRQMDEKHYLTPFIDHTVGTEEGYFLLLPSTERTSAGQNARLLSPPLPPTKGTCLKFWAFIPMSSEAQLKVWRLSEGWLNPLLLVEELGVAWKRFSVDIIAAEQYQIVFEGIRGTSGFVALDDIRYTIGVNCENQVKDSTSKSDNTGGIVASVIVVLLLIAALITLLVLYLRSKTQSSPSTRPASSSSSGFPNASYDSR
ncbi:apical endosomal glycoprotein [Synchiropus splendidus]|uniref:apical endosomal glycoprotein n=1 Tax=Synchiropus splendidus TaxID=270530 RepID=UPI00237D3A1A|nr:apical endosomal glycoprotein [Synchiropus splendidus]